MDNTCKSTIPGEVYTGIICLDFDGVIHNYRYGYTPFPNDSPVEGALDFVNWLIEKGYNVTICSARFRSEEDITNVKKWLIKHSFPIQKLTLTISKPPALLFIDDRGYRFQGPNSWKNIKNMFEAIKKGDPGTWNHPKE